MNPATCRRHKTRDWLLAICLLGSLSTAAVAPLLRSDSPCTHDGGLHYYRVVAMKQALREGTVFTRFLPDLAFGLGFPFFNYRAALSYYVALLMHLTGMALPIALNSVYVFSIVGSAITTFLLVRDHFGARAGIVAAVAYAYAPYQFLNSLLRGNAPESAAMALMPLILWAFRRLALTGRRSWFLSSVFSLVGLFLTHNISSLLFSPFLLAYLLVLWLVYGSEGHWARVGGALVLAIALAGFFLGPALLERGYVQLHLSHSNRNNDFHYNFLTLAEILSPPRPVDTSLINPPMLIHLGLVQAILGGIGLVSGLVRWQDRERRAMMILFGAAAAAMLFLSTRASTRLWEVTPLLPFVQFPWRMVGRAILPVSVLAGAAVSCTGTVPDTQAHKGLTRRLVSLLWLLTIVTVLIMSALSATYPPQGYCPSASRPTIADLFSYEHSTELVGVDPTGSYFPTWVRLRPDSSPLEVQYETGRPVARFDESVLPEGASVVEAEYKPNRARVVVDTPISFEARFLTFYFPGWRVTRDGQPTIIRVTDPEGFLAFDVPAGRHIISIRFGETPLRLALDAVSMLALLFLVRLAIRYPRQNSGGTVPRDRHLGGSRSPVPARCFWPLLVIGVMSLLFRLLVVDRAETPFRNPSLQQESASLRVPNRMSRMYADGLQLLGFGRRPAGIPADGALRLDLYWTIYAHPSSNYLTTVHLVGPDGMRWSSEASFRPRGYADYAPTSSWREGQHALDSHEIEPLIGTPVGLYDVVLTVFDQNTLAPLSVLDPYGQPTAPSLTLGQVELRRPNQPVEPPVDERIDLVSGPFTLLTAKFDRAQAAPGDPVYLTVLWRADRGGRIDSCDDCLAVLYLAAPNGSAVSSYRLTPARVWHAGDIVRSQHRLVIPATLATDTYRWSVQQNGIARTSIASLAVMAPAHTFTAPPIRYNVAVSLGSVASLAGFDIASPVRDEEGRELIVHPSEVLTVTLVWKAEEMTASSYRVFLHLIDPQGLLVSQSDGIAAGWNRPTTGWVSGEYITDQREIAVPADIPPARGYSLVSGLYLPGGDRLLAPDGADAILLTTLVVEGTR